MPRDSSGTSFDRPPTAGRRSSIRLAAAASLLLLCGWSCSDNAPREISGAHDPETIITSELCERTLDNLLDGLAPGRFGVSSDRRDLVNTLNSWKDRCSDPDAFSSSAEDGELRKRLLAEDIYAFTVSDRFSNQDAGYVRNTMLVKDVLDATLIDERTDLERAVSLFYKVVGLVDLRLPAAQSPPFGVYETCLFGMGTSADRAWLFGALLRQLRLDAVILRPSTLPADQSGSLLVGVVIPDEGVYLFDMHLGLPITSPTEREDAALPRTPITLAAAREDDGVFRQYDIRGRTYPVTAEALADVAVLAIGESSTWSPRLGALQAELPVPLVLFDGLEAHSLREHGLVKRLVMAGREKLWNEEDVAIWDYPNSVYRRAAEMTPEQQQQLDFMANVLQAPYNVTFRKEDGQAVPSVAPSSTNLHLARVQHLQGDYPAAINVYLRARLAEKQAAGQPIAPNVYGADWSAYWAILAQYEQEQYEATTQSVERYLANPGAWRSAARVLSAKSLAHRQLFREAANVLARDAIRSPQRMGNQWLIRHWRRLAENAAAGEVTERREPQPKDAEPTPLDKQPPADNEVPRQTPSNLPPAEEPPDDRFGQPGRAGADPADDSDPITDPSEGVTD